MIKVSKMKVLIIFFSMIWFLSCKHWWRFSILVIIFIELLKLFSVFNSNQKSYDEIEFYMSLPITLPIIILLILLSNKINSLNTIKKIQIKINEEINNEITALNSKSQKQIYELKSEFKTLLENKNAINETDYLEQLILIREKIINTL